MKVFLNRSGDPNGSQYWLYDKLEYNIVSNSDKLDNSQFIYLSHISDYQDFTEHEYAPALGIDHCKVQKMIYENHDLELFTDKSKYLISGLKKILFFFFNNIWFKIS